LADESGFYERLLQLRTHPQHVTLLQLESLVLTFDARYCWTPRTLSAYLDCFGSRVRAAQHAWRTFDRLVANPLNERDADATAQKAATGAPPSSFSSAPLASLGLVQPSSALYTRVLHALAHDWRPELLAHVESVLARMHAPASLATTFSATQKEALRRAFADRQEVIAKLEQHFTAKPTRRRSSNATGNSSGRVGEKENENPKSAAPTVQ
jgi:hypothetical protein